jgi:hypothetical protein
MGDCNTSIESDRGKIISEHLPYELKLYFAADINLRNPNVDTPAKIVWLELLCLHGRNLIEFFTGTQAFGAEVRTAASRHFTDASYSPAARQDGTSVGELYKTICVFASHLDYNREKRKRLEPNDIDQLRKFIGDEIARFREHLLNEYKPLFAPPAYPPSVLSLASVPSTTALGELRIAQIVPC